MKSNAAVLVEVGKPWEVMEVDVKEPREGQVLIRYVAAGLCHSDMHLMTGDLPVEPPYIGGHEGAVIIEKVGPGVTKVAPGDHVVCAFIPACGHCRWCSTGRQSLCDLGATILAGHLPDGIYAFSVDGRDAGAMCMLGTFSQYATISEHSAVKIDEDLPLETAVLVGCGVPAGWGSAADTPHRRGATGRSRRRCAAGSCSTSRSSTGSPRRRSTRSSPRWPRASWSSRGSARSGPPTGSCWWPR